MLIAQYHKWKNPTSILNPHNRHKNSKNTSRTKTCLDQRLGAFLSTRRGLFDAVLLAVPGCGVGISAAFDFEKVRIYIKRTTETDQSAEVKRNCYSDSTCCSVLVRFVDVLRFASSAFHHVFLKPAEDLL